MAESTIERLKQKALSLPLSPGVYLMADKKGKIIYVGKAKRLKNRVTSYFQDSANHTAKTRRMVARVNDFDTIIAASEFEALVLECSLIKHHQPKYNILLKDSKGYPFIKLPAEPFPRLAVSYRAEKDSARYFGPYGKWHITQQVVDSINQTLRLPTCAKNFPRDIGKGRPCLQFHMGKCIGVCRGGIDEEQFGKIMRQATMLMEGKQEGVLAELEAEMKKRSEDLLFEAAAQIRDQILAISTLGRRQIVVGGGMADTDAVACFIGDTRAGFTVLHFMDGNLISRDIELSDEPDEEPEVLLSSFISQYYLARGRVPRYVYTSHEIQDAELLREIFAEKGAKLEFLTPKRGEKRRLVEMALRNACEEVERVTTRDERIRKLLVDLQKLLNLPDMPARIEAVDISNTGDSDRVGVMVCFKDGKTLKKAYRNFIIKDQNIHDDYHAMEEVLRRRFKRLSDGDQGFDDVPGLLLVDGGRTHALMAERVISEFGLNIPVFGMVKDDRHRTRTVVSPDGLEADMTATPSLFAFIGQIQEETHRSAFAFHQKRRSGFTSALDEIKGVGKARKEALLKHFGSVRKIKEASLDELCGIVPKNTAQAVYEGLRISEDKQTQ